jgi:hypothetical protein
MAPNATDADARTDSKRFTDGVDATELIEGDRIAPQLVARTLGQLGDRRSAREDAPDTQLVAITIIDTMQDVYSALLADPETGTIVRAGRHDSQSAWTQQEADWTVREVGTRVVVEDVHELRLADNDGPVDDDREWVQDWVEVVIGDKASGHDDYSDELELDSSTLTLQDADRRKAVATISLED